MAKISKISGFPEWLPQQKRLEEQLISKIRAIYESYGFVPIETPAVELMSTLASKGEIDKEIYALKRARAEDDKESELGLHFDLTVPFARYVAQHFNEIKFPFKRYQLQKVWRGERPQKGRFREFYQFDIDIIARDTLPISADAEVLTVLARVFSELGLGKFSIQLNNRKTLLGAYREFGLSNEQRAEAVVVIDKINKIGNDGVKSQLVEAVGLDSETADRLLDLCSKSASAQEIAVFRAGLTIGDPLFLEGFDELEQTVSLIPESLRQHFKIDLSLARGLDYYTGTIVEVTLDDFPEFGSVGSGGRYNDLASQFIKKKLPGVGVSIGLTRLMDLILAQNLLEAEGDSSCKLLISVFNEEQRPRAVEVAEQFRAAGVSTEIYLTSPKLGKQIDYADSKGIPFVAFLQEDAAVIEIKDLDSKEQVVITDIQSWAKGVL